METATATATDEHEAGLESPAFLNPDTVLLYYAALAQLATVADSGTFHDLPGLEVKDADSTGAAGSREPSPRPGGGSAFAAPPCKPESSVPTPATRQPINRVHAATIPHDTGRHPRIDENPGRHGGMPRQPGPHVLHRRQQRHRLPCPPRRAYPLAAVLHASAAPPGGDLRRTAAAAGAVPLRLAPERGLGRRRTGRLDRRRDAPRSRRRGGRGRRRNTVGATGRGVRPPGRKAYIGRLGTRRPQTRKYCRRPLGAAAPDRPRCHVPARIRRGGEPRTGYRGLPTPGTDDPRLQRLARRLPRGADLDGPSCAGARPHLVRTLPRCRRAALLPAADPHRRGAPRGHRAFRTRRAGRAVPHRTVAVCTHAPFVRAAGVAGMGRTHWRAPVRRERRRRDNREYGRGQKRGHGRRRREASSRKYRVRRGQAHRRRQKRQRVVCGQRRRRTERRRRSFAGAVRRERPVGLQDTGADRHTAALRLRIRLYRRACRRQGGPGLALHRHRRAHPDTMRGVRSRKTLPQRPCESHPRRPQAGNRPRRARV